MRPIPSIVTPGHQDYDELNYIRAAILSQLGGAAELQRQIPELIRKAIDFVLDPIHTGRTRMADLDNVEKTFVGLKVEHFVRDMLDVPKGIRDLRIGEVDVDIKNTTRDTWMIPPETYRIEGPVIVIASDDDTNRCWLGLLKTRQRYLGQANRDGKRAVSRGAFQHIMWLVEGEPLPRDRWAGLDMDRFRELRREKGGTKRACKFFRENLEKPIHRDVINALLFDQKDYMKRLRSNGGARDVLEQEGIELLSGNYDSDRIRELGLPDTGLDEMIAVER